MATFPVFGRFIANLAERKPEVVDRYLAKASKRLRTFLPAFLNGLERSGRTDLYRRNLETWSVSTMDLAGVVRHLRQSEGTNLDFLSRILKRAIESENVFAANECLLFAIEQFGSDRVNIDTVADAALTFLNKRHDSSWAYQAWFSQKAAQFYEGISASRLAQILENLRTAKKVDYRIERILCEIGKRDASAVWDFFGARLAMDESGGKDREFEAMPFRFYGLEKHLSLDPDLAIRKGLEWYGSDDSRLFQYRGGRLLSSAFPDCTPEFASALATLVKVGGEREANFALAILQNYRGEIVTHPILKEIVALFPEDGKKLDRVRISIDNTGVVSGALGFANAWRARKEMLTEWLADERPAVKNFAEQHIGQLDRMITDEQRRAESEQEMRARNYPEEDDEIPADEDEPD